MSDDETYYVIEYSLDGGASWVHGRSIEGWVFKDKEALKDQRKVVRDNVRDEYGNVESIAIRVLDADDPRGHLNSPLKPTPLDLMIDALIADVKQDTAIRNDISESGQGGDSLPTMFLNQRLDGLHQALGRALAIRDGVTDNTRSTAIARGRKYMETLTPR